MATYSGLWNNEYGEQYSLLFNNDDNVLNSLARRLRPTYSTSRVRALLLAMLQGGAGEPATASHKRVMAERDLNSNVQGGKRVIENVIAVNRVTTQSDVDNFTKMLTAVTNPTPYPVDRAGNGGGNKVGW